MNPDRGNIACHVPLESRPIKPPMLTPLAQGVQPGPSHFQTEAAKAHAVARHGVVIQVALDHAPKPLANHRDRLMASSLQCLAQGHQGGPRSAFAWSRAQC